jgi:DNA adenine methylase
MQQSNRAEACPVVATDQAFAAAPFVKWAGGKRQLLPDILSRLPAKIGTYYEPFVGGGAVFFALANAGRFAHAVIGDMNLDLVNAYRQIRDRLPAVIDHLRLHQQQHSEKYFYEQRKLALRSPGASGAARFLYLNRTCFNGLYRVNKSGAFNVPFGDYKSPRILNVEGLEAASSALLGVEIRHEDFAAIRLVEGDAAYFDPPYLPASESANFRAYCREGFNVSDHERLAISFAEGVMQGAYVLLSNSDTAEARRIFAPWKIDSVTARRNINSNGGKRGAVGEILVHP